MRKRCTLQKASHIFLRSESLYKLHRLVAIKMTKSSRIQSVYELCKKTLTSSGDLPPPSQAVHKLCSLLDTVSPADVGLKEENLEDDRGYGLSLVDRFTRTAKWAQPITYVDIHECNCFTMCIFCFPTSAVIPLHDHPGMTVFSKVLYGSLHVRAYDWVEPAQIMKDPGLEIPQARLAKLKVDKVLTAPCETSVIYPRSGNLHCFTAITPCAVLDILTPPYQESAGRQCTYYHDYPYKSFAKPNRVVTDGKEEEYAWLAEMGTPDDLYMVPGRYCGPVLQVN